MLQVSSLLLLLLNPVWALPSQFEPQQPLVDVQSDIEIPSIGLGLWNSKSKDATHAVKYGFKAGYHHLDSAAAYNNEQDVGKTLTSKHAPSRSSYWITSKLWNTQHRPANVAIAFNKTLTDLNTPYLDLYLMHWPIAFLPNQKQDRTIIDQDTSILDTWRAMEKLVSTNKSHPDPGTTRYIGVSNFSPRQLDQILDICTICPYAHEFETHPFLQQQQFVDWHHKHDIKVIAYSPLANLNPTYKDKHPDVPRILDDPFWVDVAERKNVTVAQAVLGWGVARGTVVIPKSVHRERIVENLGAGKVRFSREELDEVARQDRRARFNDPSKEWGVSLFEGLDDGSTGLVMDL